MYRGNVRALIKAKRSYITVGRISIQSTPHPFIFDHLHFLITRAGKPLFNLNFYNQLANIVFLYMLGWSTHISWLSRKYLLTKHEMCGSYIAFLWKLSKIWTLNCNYYWKLINEVFQMYVLFMSVYISVKYSVNIYTHIYELRHVVPKTPYRRP